MMVDDQAREKPIDHGENEMTDIDNRMTDEAPEAKQPKKTSCEIQVDQRRNWTKDKFRSRVTGTLQASYESLTEMNSTETEADNFLDGGSIEPVN